MLTEKQLERNKNGTRAITLQKEERIREAARLSRNHTPSEICRRVGLSPRTLKRYAKDPIWQASGGVDLPTPLYVKKPGRKRDLKRERELMAEAERLRDLKMKWVQIAARLGLTVDQLEGMRRKYPQ